MASRDVTVLIKLDIQKWGLTARAVNDAVSRMAKAMGEALATVVAQLKLTARSLDQFSELRQHSFRPDFDLVCTVCNGDHTSPGRPS